MGSHTKDSLLKGRSRVTECIHIKMEASIKETSQMIVDRVQDKLLIHQDKVSKVNLVTMNLERALFIKKTGI